MLFLSVIVPTYNRKESLRITLDGLARQSYPPECFEVIVISDGSTDGTDQWLAEYAAAAPYRLQVISQENGGPARARNAGIAAATGEVVVFIDDDVEPVPDFLSAHAARHVTHPSIAIIGPMSRDPKRRASEPPWIAWEHEMLERQYANWNTGVWTGAGPNHFYSGNASVRREHLVAVKGFDESFKRQEDVEMAYRMERDCGTLFRFEAAAGGIHRPSRTYKSWLKIPYSYGQLDVVRAQRDDRAWGVVRQSYRSRNRVTRSLADIVISSPWMGFPIRSILLAAVHTTHRLRMSKVSLGLLSIIYNIHYLEGAQSEVGTPAAMRAVLAKKPLPSPSVSSK